MKDRVVTLCEEIPGLQLVATDSRFEWAAPINGWFDLETRNGSLNQYKFFAYQTSIDVSGWGNQGLSFFPIQAGIQEGSTYNYLVDDSLRVIDLISDSPLDVSAFAEPNLSDITQRTVPGLLQVITTNELRTFAPLGWENILYGNDRLFQHNNNLQGTLVLPVSSRDFGSMNPTASDKLYVTRILVLDVGITTQVGGILDVPKTRFIMKGQLKEESDLSYVFRLKDSFKTTQTDVGYNEL
jgi:hypothetical protein